MMGSPLTSDIASRIRIRRARVEDAAVLSEFAERIFRETFEASNDPADMASYLAEAFGVDRQQEEITEPGATVLLAEDIAGAEDVAGTEVIVGSNAANPVNAADPANAANRANAAASLAGYSHLTQSEWPACVHGAAPLELKRFYIDRVWQGTGLAQMLMRATFDAALAAGARTVWLGVWEHNPRAIAFYRKFAFVEVGAHDFMLGRDRQTDIIMARPA